MDMDSVSRTARRLFLLGPLLAATAVVAQPLADGPQFQVNSYTTNAQTIPRTAFSDRGDFVVVWESDGSYGSDSAGTSIQGQRFSAGGVPLGSQFQVNAYTIGNQSEPNIAADGQGRFVLIWASFGSDGTDHDLWSIQGRRYSVDGVPLGGQFQINTYTTQLQELPALSVSPAGDFVVTWFSSGSADTSYESIEGQRYDANGSPVGGEFRVNTFTDGGPNYSAVASAADGRFVVAWQSFGTPGTDTSGRGIRARLFASDGTPLGDEFQVNTYTTNNQYHPAVAMEQTGDFVVAWESYGSAGTDTNFFSIQARRYDASGVPLGDQFQVNTFTTYGQRFPRLGMDSRGGFVVAWQNDRSLVELDQTVRARRYDAAGVPVGDEFQVNSYTFGAQTLPDVASDDIGDFVVVWQSLGSSGTDTSFQSIQGQRFDSLFRDGFEGGDTARWSTTQP
jgi:hypothetical protein